MRAARRGRSSAHAGGSLGGRARPAAKAATGVGGTARAEAGQSRAARGEGAQRARCAKHAHQRAGPGEVKTAKSKTAQRAAERGCRQGDKRGFGMLFFRRLLLRHACRTRGQVGATDASLVDTHRMDRFVRGGWGFPAAGMQSSDLADQPSVDCARTQS
ncbi:hypothetical protein ERJ75_001141800 [Trypanosoma vivax]|nr:hypothetical protein ERJ75_001141800 [Trypanosoma vivax]